MWVNVFSLAYPIASFVLLLFSWKYTKFNARLLSNAAISFLIFAAILQYIKCSFGIDYTDTAYDLSLIEFQKYDKSVMTFGTILLFNKLLGLINYSIFASRIIATLIFQMSCILPFVTYLYINKIKLTSFEFHLSILSLCVLFLVKTGTNALSYDLITTFIISILISLCFAYKNKPTYINIALISIVSALLVAVRFPNIIIVVLFPILILLNNTSKNQLIFVHIICYYLIASIAYCVIVVIAYGDILNYVSVLGYSFDNALNHNATHGVNYMTAAIVRDCVKLLIYTFIIASLFVYEGSNILKENTILRKCFVAFYIVVTFVFLMNNDRDYGCNIKLYELAICTILISLLFWKKNYSIAFLALMFLILPIAGSDTGLLKVGVALCLPFLIVEVLRFYKIKKALAIALLALLLYFPMAYITTYEDSIIFLLSKKMKSERLSNIYTSEDRVAAIREGVGIIHSKKNEGYEVIVLGNYRYLFEYLCGINNSLLQPWRISYNDKQYIDDIMKYVKTQSNELFFVVTYKQDNEKCTDLLINFEENNVQYKLLECK